MRAVRYVTAHRGDAESFRQSPLFKSIGEREPLYARLNNEEGLSKVYNRILDGDYEQFTSFGPEPDGQGSGEIVVFLHDDLEIIGSNCATELNRAADAGFAIVGLAGGTRVMLRAPALWHLMTPKGAHSGNSVFQIHQRDWATGQPLRDPLTGRLVVDRSQPWPSVYGPYSEVVILDGLFLAVVLSAVSPAGWRFDERFNYHHYDMASCLLAHQAGLKMRTVCIPVIHWSIGLEVMNDEFRRSEKVFLEAYAPNGPVEVSC